MNKKSQLPHSKYKNTGILFELLVHQITQDTLKGDNSPAISLIKKYFTKSELGREYKLYNSFLKSKVINESRANMLINTILNSSNKLNRSSIRSQKYNLIKEIKENYNVNSFFNNKIYNYKILASIYTLIESYNSPKIINSDQIVNNKINLLEFLTKQNVKSEDVEEDVLKEFKNCDKDVRNLTYMILLEKFNSKYDDFSKEQKSILREYINLGDSSYSLRNFYNEKIVELKRLLTEEVTKIKDKVTEIKSEEILNFLVELNKEDRIEDEHLVDLLQYYELLEEIKKVNNVLIK